MSDEAVDGVCPRGVEAAGPGSALAAQVGGAIVRLRDEAALRDELARLRGREASGARPCSSGRAE